MKYFLAALHCPQTTAILLNKGIIFHWNLLSYFYHRTAKQEQHACLIRDNSEEILIDSGAFSFQNNKEVDSVDLEKYTEEYAEFIKRFDRPNVAGFFEMDIDNKIGYDKVLKLRKILEKVSDKIIPVWHKNRGIEDFDKMCREYAGKYIAIAKRDNLSINDRLIFIKHAKKYNCKVHGLALCSKKSMDSCPFTSIDSANWIIGSSFRRYFPVYNLNTARSFKFSKKDNILSIYETRAKNYEGAMRIQEFYFNYWKNIETKKLKEKEEK